MIKINLLPFRAARKKENIRRQISVFLLFFLFVFSGLFFYNLQLSNQVNEARERLKVTEEALTKYEKKAKEVDQIQGKLKILNQKLDVMAKLNMDREAPVNLLETITELAVSGRMWIVELSDESNSVLLSGIAMDNATVAMFMSRVEQSDFFSGAELFKVAHHNEEGLKLKNFEMRCFKSR